MNQALILKNLFGSSADINNLHWQEYKANHRTGVEIFPLYNARNEHNKGSAAALLRYKPGARVARHVHLGYELIFVLEGILHNDTGKHYPGELEICPPCSTHELWSDSGCIFLVVWEQPVANMEE